MLFAPQILVRRQPKIVTAAGDTTTGLVSYWPLNDGSGSTAADTIGGHTMTVANTTLWVSDYYNFSATATGVVSDHADFDVSSAFTAFGWINGASQAEGYFCGHWQATTTETSWLIGNTVGGGNTLTVYASDNGAYAAVSDGHTKRYYGSQTLLDSTWHSFAARFNAGVLDLFVDGVKDTSVTKNIDDAITTVFTTSTAKFVVADLDDRGLFKFNCAMKKIRFYNIAKTDADIVAIHALGQ